MCFPRRTKHQQLGDISMPSEEAERGEVLDNYQVFVAQLPRLQERNAGRYAVYRHRQLIEIFDKFAEALVYCGSTFGDRQFSIQEITAEPLDFWWFANAATPSLVRTSSGTSH
jgi:hypothetical protein